MSTPAGLTPVLTAELNRLNDRQRQAVLHPASQVVRAGPGSGKTRTLVAKAAYLLEAQIPPRQGLAAITYTRPAAQEIAHRLDRLGVPTGRRLTASTLHSWCLNSVLRPYGPLVGMPVPGQGGIVDDQSDEWTDLLQRCFDATGVSGKAQWERPAITKIRRRIAAGIPENQRDPMVQAAVLFDQQMITRGWFDFDLMIAQGLKLLRRNPRVTRLVATRYPWLIVDEYQDLGPVLHALVTYLHDSAGVHIAAFGDPDQTIMGFTGADPSYLLDLTRRNDFLDLELDINYRCGSTIISASHAAVDGQRAHQADPNRADAGVIDAVNVAGGLDGHAAVAVSKIDELVTRGVAPHHIAILYPRKGPVLDALREALDASNHDYVHENDQRLPTGELVDFIRDCAARAIAGPQPIGYADVDHAAGVPTIHDLVDAYRDLLGRGGVASPGRRAVGRTLSEAMRVVKADDSLEPWLKRLVGATNLTAVAAASPQLRDRGVIDALAVAAQDHNLTVGDIAGALRIGKVTLTTYHSAKGREWDIVLLPGLVDGMMPFRKWSKRHNRYLEPPRDRLEQDRRAFYVGLTRARRAAVLIYGDHWSTPWGALNRYGVSRFATAVINRIRKV